ncbi:MAG: TIGR02587 family membrane protein [Chloroflexi bacterium]|nr:TIGR02587 family membrane protein [Chloroflexota bacterium]
MARDRGQPDEDGGDGRTVMESARDHLRLIAGGLLVGLPLLWTMEVWDDGAVLPAGKLLVLLAIAFAVVVGFNALAGFRRERSWRELLVDSVQALGLSVIVAAGALAVLGRLDPTLGLPTLIGRIAIETIPVAFGASLAATVMAAPDENESGGLGPDAATVGSLGRLLVAGAGALYFALNIAPTDEVRILAAEATEIQLLVAVLVSLATSLAIVFHAEFRGGRSDPSGDGPLDGPIGETIAAYAVSLIISLVLLWSFGSTDGTGPRTVLAQVVMLGIVASFGAAAGRLLVGSGSAGAGGGGSSGQREGTPA